MLRNAFVFPGEARNDHFVGIARVLTRLFMSAELEPITPHVLWYTFASFAGDLGFPELTVAALLGHASRGVTQRYVHLDQAVQLAAERVCDEIAVLLGSLTQRQISRPPNQLSRNRTFIRFPGFDPM